MIAVKKIKIDEQIDDSQVTYLSVNDPTICNKSIHIPPEITRLILNERGRLNMHDLLRSATLNSDLIFKNGYRNRYTDVPVAALNHNDPIKELCNIIHETGAIVAGSSCLNSLLYNIYETENSTKGYWKPSDIDIFIDKNINIPIHLPHANLGLAVIRDNVMAAYSHNNNIEAQIDYFVKSWIIKGEAFTDLNYVKCLSFEFQIIYNHLDSLELLTTALFNKSHKDVFCIHPFEYKLLKWYIKLMLDDVILYKHSIERILDYNKGLDKSIYDIEYADGSANCINWIRSRSKYESKLLSITRKYIKPDRMADIYSNRDINSDRDYTKCFLETAYKFTNSLIKRICTYNFGNQIDLQIIYVDLSPTLSNIELISDNNSTADNLYWAANRNVKEWIDRNFDLDICKSKFDGHKFTAFSAFKAFYNITELSVIPYKSDMPLTSNSKVVFNNTIVNKLPGVDNEVYHKIDRWSFNIDIGYDQSVLYTDIDNSLRQLRKLIRIKKYHHRYDSSKCDFNIHAVSNLAIETALCTTYVLEQWVVFSRLDKSLHNIQLHRIFKYIQRGFTIALPVCYIVDPEIFLERICNFISEQRDCKKIPLLLALPEMYLQVPPTDFTDYSKWYIKHPAKTQQDPPIELCLLEDEKSNSKSLNKKRRRSDIDEDSHYGEFDEFMI